MIGYGTNENYLRSFGGPISADASTFDKDGTLRIEFSRPVVMPTSLMKEFDDAYVETIPDLTLTDAELAEIRELFEQS